MSYSDFTLETVGRLLGVTARAATLFPNLPHVNAKLDPSFFLGGLIDEYR